MRVVEPPEELECLGITPARAAEETLRMLGKARKDDGREPVRKRESTARDHAE